MTLTELRYLVALSETGHFRKAAEQCNVSQPTLSIAIKRLEEELDVPLFERSRHKVTATPIGERIVKQAVTILQETQNLVQLAQQGKDPLGSVLSVGAIYTVGPYLFPRLVSGLQAIAPDMPLFIEESYTAVLRAKLSRGQLDAIFIALPFTEPEVVTRPVYDEPFVVVMPQDHPLAGQKRVDPASLDTAFATRFWRPAPACSRPSRMTTPVARRSWRAARWKRSNTWSLPASASRYCPAPRQISLPMAARRWWCVNSPTRSPSAPSPWPGA